MMINGHSVSGDNGIQEVRGEREQPNSSQCTQNIQHNHHHHRRPRPRRLCPRCHPRPCPRPRCPRCHRCPRPHFSAEN